MLVVLVDRARLGNGLALTFGLALVYKVKSLVASVQCGYVPLSGQSQPLFLGRRSSLEDYL